MILAYLLLTLAVLVSWAKEMPQVINHPILSKFADKDFVAMIGFILYLASFWVFIDKTFYFLEYKRIFYLLLFSVYLVFINGICNFFTYRYIKK